MPSSFQTLSSALNRQTLFEDKTWRLSPEPWRLTPQQVTQLEQIGDACLAFYKSMDQLYHRSLQGKNLLRNKQLLAPWVAGYLERGKPARVVQHGRRLEFKGQTPLVIRPDLLLTEEGFVLTELDSVPGGVGLTAFLNQLYAQDDANILGGNQSMVDGFYRALAALKSDIENPLIGIVVSDEAATYRPEFEYIAALLQAKGRRVYVAHPADIMPLGKTLCLPVDGNPEKIDIIYRFWELFDVENVATADFIFKAVEDEDVVISPPMKSYQEEKLNLALLHHHALEDYWRESLPKFAWKTLKKIIPRSWVMDPVELPPNAVLDAPPVQGKPIRTWEELGEASQKERKLIIKISGFHETAWGARSVVLGSDSSREEWQAGIRRAIDMADNHLHILQAYHKPMRLQHPVYQDADKIVPMNGRLRLCPYYFVHNDKAELSGVLATFCPADKKIIHGMPDAALLPCQVVDAT